MKLNYRPLGEFVKQINIKNTGLKVKKLIGVSMNKMFIESVANINGVDFENYKIIKKNQFACKLMSVGRDKKLPVDLLKKYDEAIVSSAYYVFEVIDENIVLPEYLMMWFRRSESDRYVGFISGGDVRGGISWDDLCTMPIIVPDIEIQKEIVKEYDVIINRIELNNQLIQKLEDTAQTIFKQWFENFEFPDEKGNQYNSSGGEMDYNEELDKYIPKGWTKSSIGKIAEVIDCLHSKKPEQATEPTGNILLQVNNLLEYGLLGFSKIFWINDKDYNKWTSRIEASYGDCIVTNVGKDAVVRVPYGIKLALGRNMTGIRVKKEFNFPTFLYYCLTSNWMENEIRNKKDTGTILEALNVKTIPALEFIKPNDNIITIFENYASVLRNKLEEIQKEKERLTEFKQILLSKMTKIVTVEH